MAENVDCSFILRYSRFEPCSDTHMLRTHMLRYSDFLQTPGWLKITITQRVRSESFRLNLAFPSI
jgi:hypothetical protein